MTTITYKRPKLTNYQKEILDDPARFTVTEASTKAGKTVSHIIWLFEQALQIDKEKSVWWVSPVYGQAEIAFRRMKNYIRPRELYTANETKMRITLVTGAIIEFKSAEKPDNLFGEDVFAAVFDEFTRAREEAWFALRSTLSATEGRCKFIGNVKGKKNWGYRMGLKAKAGEPGYSYHKITAVDAVKEGILNQEEIDQAQKDLPEAVFKELYLAEPSEDGSNPFGINHIQNSLIDSLAAGPVAVFGVDIAKSTDWTVIIGLNDKQQVCYFDRFQKDWKQTKETIINTVRGSFGYIDSTGVGDPVVEDVQRQCNKLQGYRFSSDSKQDLMEQLAIDLQNNRLKFPKGIIKDEMEQFEFVYSNRRVKYSAPAGVHDDCVCALALANMAFKDRTKAKVSVW